MIAIATVFGVSACHGGDAEMTPADAGPETNAEPGPTGRGRTVNWPIEEMCQRREPTDALREWLQAHPACLEGRTATAMFRDATLEAGLVHRHRFDARVNRHSGYARTVGGGVAMADFDGDGAPDLYVTGGQATNRLFINRGDGVFWDCTAATGLGLEADWTNGASAADYDNDGDQDLFVANAGPDRLFENLGGGEFREVDGPIGSPGRSATASWGDVDGDGRLDLAVASLEEQGLMPGDDDVFSPTHPTTLWLNREDGFREVGGGLAGAERLERSSYTAPLLDLDGDRDVDWLVTGEFRANLLYRNPGSGGNSVGGDSEGGAPAHGDGSGPPAVLEPVEADGAATIAERPGAPMGLDVLDVDADARPDLAMSNLWGVPPQREVLLLNRGGFRFQDRAGERRAYAAVRGRHTAVTRANSWSVLAVDVDNDADRDLYYVYGHFSPPESCHPYEPIFGANCDLERPYYRAGQPNALLINDGRGRFEEAAGACVAGTGQGRGAAAGDVDGDGCTDLVVVNQEGAVRLFVNRCRDAGRYLKVELRGRRSNRDGVGARVEVRAGGQRQVRWRVAGVRGVHSSSPGLLDFGLGEVGEVDAVVVRWPSGTVDRVEDVEVDRRIVVEEGRSGP